MFILILFLVLIIILVLLNRKKEHASSLSNTSLTNDEAIKNIASLYNSSNMVVTNLTVTGDLSANRLSAQNFKGMIVAYSGDVSSIPDGWALCDGTNGTPDLRGRFIFGFNPNDQGPKDNSGNLLKDGSGNLYRPILPNKSIGGEEYHQLTIPELPSHTHNYWYRWWGSGVSNRNTPAGDSWGQNDRDYSTTATGNNIPHNNMPPYMVLAYVMKL